MRRPRPRPHRKHPRPAASGETIKVAEVMAAFLEHTARSSDARSARKIAAVGRLLDLVVFNIEFANSGKGTTTLNYQERVAALESLFTGNAKLSARAMHEISIQAGRKKAFESGNQRGSFVEGYKLYYAVANPAGFAEGKGTLSEDSTALRPFVQAEWKDISQADFARVANPYFKELGRMFQPINPQGLKGAPTDPAVTFSVGDDEIALRGKGKILRTLYDSSSKLSVMLSPADVEAVPGPANIVAYLRQILPEKGVDVAVVKNAFQTFLPKADADGNGLVNPGQFQAAVGEVWQALRSPEEDWPRHKTADFLQQATQAITRMTEKSVPLSRDWVEETEHLDAEEKKLLQPLIPAEGFYRPADAVQILSSNLAAASEESNGYVSDRQWKEVQAAVVKGLQQRGSITTADGVPAGAMKSSARFPGLGPEGIAIAPVLTEFQELLKVVSGLPTEPPNTADGKRISWKQYEQASQQSDIAKYVMFGFGAKDRAEFEKKYPQGADVAAEFQRLKALFENGDSPGFPAGKDGSLSLEELEAIPFARPGLPVTAKPNGKL